MPEWCIWLIAYIAFGGFLAGLFIQLEKKMIDHVGLTIFLWPLLIMLLCGRAVGTVIKGDHNAD